MEKQNKKTRQKDKVYFSLTPKEADYLYEVLAHEKIDLEMFSKADMDKTEINKLQKLIESIKNKLEMQPC